MRINLDDVAERDFLAFCDLPVTDCHTHVTGVDDIFHVESVETRYRIAKINVMATTSYGEDYLANNPLCLLFKLLFPEKSTAFGSLCYPPLGAPSDGRDFLAQAQNLMAMGFDGMKMMEGKPDARRRIGIPLDSPVFDEYYGYLESNGIPLLYHVNDPAMFWDRERAPQYVIDRGWAYSDASFMSKEGIYGEIDGMLNKFPRLRVIFAHFYFMDEEGLGRAGDFLDRWPQVSFDLAPGLHFTSFERDLDAWRGFFVKYQDRIIFGTDNDYGMGRQLIYTIRTILETDNEIEFWDTPLHGMKLDRAVLEKIYSANFAKYARPTVKKADTSLMREDCAKIERRALHSPGRERELRDIRDIRAQLEKMGMGW